MVVFGQILIADTLHTSLEFEVVQGALILLGWKGLVSAQVLSGLEASSFVEVVIWQASHASQLKSVEFKAIQSGYVDCGKTQAIENELVVRTTCAEFSKIVGGLTLITHIYVVDIVHSLAVCQLRLLALSRSLIVELLLGTTKSLRSHVGSILALNTLLGVIFVENLAFVESGLAGV